MEAWMLRKPGLNFRMLMSSVVVDNAMNIQFLGRIAINCSEEFEELLMTMAMMALTDDFSFENIQCRKQRSCTITFVVVRHGSRSAFLQRKRWLCPIKRLDLAFLINAKDEGILRWIHVQSNHVFKLFHKVFIVAQFERLHEMRLETVCIPDALHGGFADPAFLRHAPSAPVRGIFRFCLQRLLNDCSHFLGG